jgi:hypothetical protein
MLRGNFLETGALPIPLYLLTAPLFLWLGPNSQTRLRALVWRTFLFAALSVLFVALASLAGKLPWSWYTRWSIGYQTLSACCLAMIVIMTGTWFWQGATGWYGKARVMLLGACFAVAWFMQVREAVRSEHPYYETIATQLRELRMSDKAQSLRFFVQVNATPTTRYLVELGPLKERFRYPRNFHFETPQEVQNRTSISAKEYDVIVLTHTQFIEAYSARITDGGWKITANPLPSCLLMLTPNLETAR